ncbi:MAG: thiazole synthase, partial [Kofleriaceae bacterium]
MTASTDTWSLGDRVLRSRIIVGTGKYGSLDETRHARAASGAEIVTVALRRIDLTSKEPTLLDANDRSNYQQLPNTARCYTADHAIRTRHHPPELG